MYHSQYEQDKWLNEHIFHNMENGTFLDVGAHDGVTINNTYFFEKELGWTGLLVEPIPSVFKKLKTNRTSAVLQACAWTKKNQKKFKIIEGYSEMLSGLTDQYTPEHKERVKNEVKNMKQKTYEIDVDCFDINDILSGKNGGIDLCKLDLLSIDTEGSEEVIIQHIDFAKFDISVIVMENNYDHEPIRKFLRSKGYRYVKRLEIDDIFVKKRGIRRIFK